MTIWAWRPSQTISTVCTTTGSYSGSGWRGLLFCITMSPTEKCSVCEKVCIKNEMLLLFMLALLSLCCASMFAIKMRMNGGCFFSDALLLILVLKQHRVMKALGLTCVITSFRVLSHLPHLVWIVWHFHLVQSKIARVKGAPGKRNVYSHVL